MIKALFFDIDGTLVSFTTHRIPATTIEALTQAHDRGIDIYISTGRPLPIINNLGDIAHLIDGYITTNGAYCFIGDEVISRTVIAPEDVDYVTAKARELGFPCMVVGCDSLTMYNSASQPEAVERVCRMLNVSLEPERPLAEIAVQGVLQLTPLISAELEEQIIVPREGLLSGRWCPEFTDLTAAGVNKAKGLREIAARRGFDISETLAMGDGGNDLSMIRTAGIGVAMANANPILLSAADYITTSVDSSGVLHALRHFHII